MGWRDMRKRSVTGSVPAGADGSSDSDKYPSGILRMIGVPRALRSS